MIPIIQGNCYISKSLRLSKLCTGENNVLHTGTAQLFDTLLTQYPADGIGYIAFSASVWAYNACDTIVKFKKQFIGKGLKSLYFNAF